MNKSAKFSKRLNSASTGKIMNLRRSYVFSKKAIKDLIWRKRGRMQNTRRRFKTTNNRFRILIQLLERHISTEMHRLRASCSIKQIFKRWRDSFLTFNQHMIKTRLCGRANASSSKTKRKITKKICKSLKESLRLLLNSCRSAEIMLKISTSSIKTLWPK
jgi:hypothetical protein